MSGKEDQPMKDYSQETINFWKQPGNVLEHALPGMSLVTADGSIEITNVIYWPKEKNTKNFQHVQDLDPGMATLAVSNGNPILLICVDNGACFQIKKAKGLKNQRDILEALGLDKMEVRDTFGGIPLTFKDESGALYFNLRGETASAGSEESIFGNDPNTGLRKLAGEE